MKYQHRNQGGGNFSDHRRYPLERDTSGRNFAIAVLLCIALVSVLVSLYLTITP